MVSNFLAVSYLFVWLKQKQPTNHILRGGISNNNDGSHEVGQNKIITDGKLL